MECNRDEALRAWEIAEKKFRLKDVAGAKKFALKAQNLYPALEGISQLLATLDIHLASETVMNGVRDWYAILDVSATADDETVKKQYRKLALMLHPDKNKSVGAETAFQLVSEAWSILCDKTRRMAYDQRRNMGADQQRSSHSSNGFFHHAKNAPKQNSATASSNVPPSQPPKTRTFWTSCHNCKMQYEYLRIYVNHNLLCPNCHKPFLAVETPNPTNGHNPPVPWTTSQQQKTSKTNKNAFRQKKSVPTDPGRDFQSVTFQRQPGAATAGYSSQPANMVNEAYGNLRREEEHAHGLKRTASFNDGFPEGDQFSFYNIDRPEKRRRGINEDGRADYTGGNLEVKEGVVQGNQTFINHVPNVNGTFGDYGKFRTHRHVNLRRELSQIDTRSMLMQKGQLLVKKKLEVREPGNIDKATEKESKKIDGRNGRGNENDSKADEADKLVKVLKKAPHKHNSLNKPRAGSDQVVQQPVQIDVPDPDFHDFDGDRSERCFEPDQVWATYDDEDGMPRLYALVQKIISLKPFKIRMSFLTSKSNSELGPLDWVGKGFAKTCGDFRVSRYEVKDSINIFSHKVQWEKGARGVIKILPKKGETWALYRNWSPDWNEHTPDEVVYKYDMVEVLEDYNEEQGVTVTPLVKVAGFKTVFHRHMDINEMKKIPREEMFRFSHQVPTYSLTGMEAPGAPKGCNELDPAATPIELLQVITEAREDDKMETSQVNQN